MPTCIYSESLTEETRALIRDKFPKTEGAGHPELFAISMDMGVSMRTLELFRDGITKNPNAETVQIIYEKLTGNKLLTAA